ncbi:MAG TPA: ABC transporter permease, partial [Actinomycetota bacterium]|nr:ABC transporter permease [Actinomycetota bacterium]
MNDSNGANGANDPVGASGASDTGGARGPDAVSSTAQALSTRDGVRLIAGREIRERTRARSFRIVTVVLIAIGVGAVAIPASTANNTPPVEDVGLVGTYAQPLQRSMAAAGTSVGVTVHLHSERDLTAAKAALASGAIDLAVVDSANLLVQNPIDKPTSSLGRLTSALSLALGLSKQLAATGLSPDQVEHALQAQPLTVTTIEHVAADIGKRRILAYVGLLILYLALITYGGWIAVGVLEEKSSRIVEILLSTVRPATLMAGKVVGIGACGLLQFGSIVVAALVTASAIGKDVLPSGSTLAILSALMWFLVGFAFYSSLYAAAGSLGSKTQDAQAVVAPLQVLLLIIYLVGTITALANPDAPLIVVMSFFPPTAPMTMSVRAIVGDVPAWQIAISLALTLVTTVFLIRLAGRVYASAILRTGPRMKFRQALREANEPG